LISTDSSDPIGSHNVNLSLSQSATDGIVSVAGTATLTATDWLNAQGTQATADITVTGASSTTGASGHQARILAQSSGTLAFVLGGPALAQFTYSGSANLIARDPSGFDGYTYTGIRSVYGGGPLPTLIESSPATFDTSGRALLGPGFYEIETYQQSYDLQNPNLPGSYSESTSAMLHLDLLSVPEPSTAVVIALSGLGALALGKRFRQPW
jgi:hypothetical protein